MKKFLTYLLATILLACAFSFVGCDSGTKGLVYSLNSDETSYSVTGIETEEELTEIIIPAKYKGKQVSSIGSSAFKGYATIETVTLPDTITTIGAMAFQNCKALKSINTPLNLSTLSKSAFKGCSSLENFVIPEVITEISESTFENSGIKTVPMHDKLDKIGDKAFKNCDQITEFKAGAKLRVVGVSAFEGCDKLKTVDFGNYTKALEASCFRDCVAIERIYIPKQLAHIYELSFYGCTSLTYMEFQINQNTWKQYMTENCKYTPWRNTGQPSPSLGNMSMAPDLTDPTLNPYYFVDVPPTPLSDLSDTRGKTRQDLGWDPTGTYVIWEYAASYDRYFFLCDGDKNTFFNGTSQYWKGNY